jgi:hypothetical protein
LTKWTRAWEEYDIDICLHDYNEQKHKTKIAIINLSQCSGTMDATGRRIFLPKSRKFFQPT